MYNDNSNSYTSSNSNRVDNIRITHNSNKLNEIVAVSSNPSINAIMRITSASRTHLTNFDIISISSIIINLGIT